VPATQPAPAAVLRSGSRASGCCSGSGKQDSHPQRAQAGERGLGRAGPRARGGEVVLESLEGAGPRRMHLGERVGRSCSWCGRPWRWVLQDDCELRATGLQGAEGEGSKG
jgi:hypothetical protein